MRNIHASLVQLNGKGVLISGPSGSGKTLLALHLFRRCAQAGLQSDIIADDQVFLSLEDNQLFGSTANSIAGQIEVHGFGPVSHGGKVTISPVDLHVALGNQTQLIRYWDETYFEVENCKIRSLHLSTDKIEAAGNAVLAALGFSQTV